MEFPHSSPYYRLNKVASVFLKTTIALLLGSLQSITHRMNPQPHFRNILSTNKEKEAEHSTDSLIDVNKVNPSINEEASSEVSES